jgi:phosphosulfolactate phosphohydrolase-like enzyme
MQQETPGGQLGMKQERKVRIEAPLDGVLRHRDCDAVVYVDVLLAGTAVVTALADGRRTFVVGGVREAQALRRELGDALLGHEGGTPVPEGFEALGPAALAARTDRERPLVLTCAWAGSMAEASRFAAVYVASLRNLTATVEGLARHHANVALVGVGFGGEARCEDRVVAAQIARGLMRRGFWPEGLTTNQEVDSWSEAAPSIISLGKSAEYLRRQGRHEELEFVLRHVDDLGTVCRYEDGELNVLRSVAAERQVQGSAPVVVAYVSRNGLDVDALPVSRVPEA